MPSFEITLTDRSEHRIHGADAYQQEGPMTTFFASQANHGRLDSWSVRIASFRSADIAMIRRIDAMEASMGRRPLEVVAGA